MDRYGWGMGMRSVPSIAMLQKTIQFVFASEERKCGILTEDREFPIGFSIHSFTLYRIAECEFEYTTGYTRCCVQNSKSLP